MKRNRTNGGEQGEWTQPDPPPATQREFLITELETVRILADPTRLRILELLVVEPQTVKRLAVALSLPQTKLYYHINLLEAHGLIHVVATRVVSGIIERRYAAAARSYRVDETLLRVSPPEGGATFDMVVTTMLDGVKQDISRALAAGLIDVRDDAPAERRMTFGRAPLRLTPERAAELHARLGELFKEYSPSSAESGEPEPDARLYDLFVAYFPISLADDQASQE